jgi:Zn-finger nucleic acid-binding protein
MRIVDGRDYFFCEYCGSFLFPKESRDRVRVLGERTNLRCPACRQLLVSASVGGANALHCSHCRGVLMRQETFASTVRYLRAQASTPPIPPQPLNQEELERRVLCPLCRHQLDTHPYYGPGNVVVDICTHCALIWLDYGELSHILDAPGRDRGR